VRMIVGRHHTHTMKGCNADLDAVRPELVEEQGVSGGERCSVAIVRTPCLPSIRGRRLQLDPATWRSDPSPA
jgi:hypothetical protein